MKTFLKAHWRNLIMVNYEVPEAALKSFLPAGTELDLWNGKSYVSVVAFLFDRMNVLGIPAIGNRCFEEVNLRFYIKRFENGEWKRGVAFIKEIVPKPLVSVLANGLFSEHYETCRMTHAYETKDDRLNFRYALDKKGSHEISADVSLKENLLKAGSFEEFIAEHYWGYSKVSETKTVEYEVQHPKWNTYQDANIQLRCNYQKLYGSDWTFLNTIEPISCFVAKGSQVEIGFPRIIKIQ